MILKNTNNCTGDAGSLLAYHPLRDTVQYQNEKDFKDSCCASGHCYIYYNKRPHGQGAAYSPPAGGKIKAQILHW